MRNYLYLFMLLLVSIGFAVEAPRLVQVDQSTSETNGVSNSYTWALAHRKVVIRVVKRRAEEPEWVLRFGGDREGRPNAVQRKVWTREDGEIATEAFVPVLIGTLDKFRADHPGEVVREVSVEMHKVTEIWGEFWEWLDRAARSEGVGAMEPGGRFDRLYRQFVHSSPSIQKMVESIRQHGYEVDVRAPWYDGNIAWSSIVELRRVRPQENLGRYLAAPGGFGLNIQWKDLAREKR